MTQMSELLCKDSISKLSEACRGVMALRNICNCRMIAKAGRTKLLTNDIEMEKFEMLSLQQFGCRSAGNVFSQTTDNR